jgi:lysozyme
MKICDKGLAIIKKYEGFYNKPYLCPALIYTIGYGHVLYPEQARLPLAQRKAYPLKAEHNRVWSKEEINDLLIKDLARFERGVTMLFPVSYRFTQGTYDALVSFSFNLGLGALQRSTVRSALLRGDKTMAGESLLKYCRAGGKILKGLQLRRQAEHKLLMT